MESSRLSEMSRGRRSSAPEATEPTGTAPSLHVAGEARQEPDSISPPSSPVPPRTSPVQQFWDRDVRGAPRERGHADVALDQDNLPRVGDSRLTARDLTKIFPKYDGKMDIFPYLDQMHSTAQFNNVAFAQLKP